MKWFKVKLYNISGDLFRTYVVQSKQHRTAISNVLSNKYKGSEPISQVNCQEVKVIPVPSKDDEEDYFKPIEN